MDSVRKTEEMSAAVVVSPGTRISLKEIEDAIAAEYTTTLGSAFRDSPITSAMETMTLHVIVLKNGFMVIGKSAPADPLNFNAELGQNFAREDCIRQLWPLMAFGLREQIADQGALYRRANNATAA